MITVEEARKLYADTKLPYADADEWHWCAEVVPELCDEIERLRTALAVYANPANWTIQECIDDDGDSAEYAVVWIGGATTFDKGHDVARAALGAGDEASAGEEES